MANNHRPRQGRSDSRGANPPERSQVVCASEAAPGGTLAERTQAEKANEFNVGATGG
jgi:hypothetical protein